jgi:hypothetical protein
MATKTSAHVWLLVLYLDCSLQGAQASPPAEILASKAIRRPDILGEYLQKNATLAVELNKFVGPQQPYLVDRIILFRYTEVYHKQPKPTNRMLSHTYHPTCRILNLNLQKSGVGTAFISSGGEGNHYFSVTWSIPADVDASIEIFVTFNAASKKYISLYFMNILILS